MLAGMDDIGVGAGINIKARRKNVVVVKRDDQSLAPVVRNGIKMPAFKGVRAGQVVPRIVFQTRAE